MFKARKAYTFHYLFLHGLQHASIAGDEFYGNGKSVSGESHSNFIIENDGEQAF